MKDENARFFDYWDGRLDEWLELVVTGDPDGASPDWHYFSFPTAGLLSEYITDIHDRPEDEILCLLRWFLFSPTTLGGDQTLLELRLLLAKNGVRAPSPPREYMRSLVRSSITGSPAQPGLRWVLDLLPHWPHSALRVIESYLLVYGQALPDGRLSGLGDASTLIRARYVESSRGDVEAARSALLNLRPRELEQLTAAAYRAAGYETRVTQQSRDGGRDVEATIIRDGMTQRLLVECKQWTGAVGVDQVRALAGVVGDDRATSGVLVTTGRFSPEAAAFAGRSHQLHLIDGPALIRFLDEALGAGWSQRIDRYLVVT